MLGLIRLNAKLKLQAQHCTSMTCFDTTAVFLLKKSTVSSRPVSARANSPSETPHQVTDLLLLTRMHVTTQYEVNLHTES